MPTFCSGVIGDTLKEALPQLLVSLTTTINGSWVAGAQTDASVTRDDIYSLFSAEFVFVVIASGCVDAFDADAFVELTFKL